MRSTVLTLFAVLFLGVLSDAAAQDARWQAYPSFRNVQALGVSGDALWAGTEGGVFRYAPASGEIERFTPVQGLSSVDAQAIAYDAARDAVWIGYTDGVIDRLDVATGEVTSFFDIAQADRFNTRSINRIEVAADSLLIATGFGVVVFDAARNEVSDTYERFGTLPAGTSVEDVLTAPLPDGTPGLWVGTRAGVAYAPLDTPNFREPSAWTVDPEAPTDVLSLAFFDDTIFAGVERVDDEEGDVRARDAGGAWDRLRYSNWSVPDLLVGDGALIAVSSFKLTVRTLAGTAEDYDAAGRSIFKSGAFGPEGNVWVGDELGGLIAFPDFNTVEEGDVEPEQIIRPDGPLSNTILSLDVAEDGAVWVGFEASSPRINGFARFDGTTWTNFSAADGTLPAWSAVSTTHVDDRGNVWLGTGDTSRGTGVFQYTAEGEIIQYTPESSSLLPSDPRDPNYVVTAGLTTDDAGRLWVTNRFAATPLHVRTPEGEWQGIDRPSGVPSTVSYDRVFIDSFGQKWITGYQDDGFLVLDTGADPLDASDDRAVFTRRVGSSAEGTGLPNAEVNAIVEDRSGRMWLGTERGLATIFSPGSAFAGNIDSQITWARVPDGTDYFLRDLRIFDIAVDPADRKWLASSSGVWLIDAEGTEVIANFTTENSPLPSDVVVAVAVDEQSGTVHFATSGGLYSYRGDAVAPSRAAEDLFVYPNPVRGNGGALPEIAIEGLVDDADVRVLTVDGQLVASFQTRGGSVRWDGRDQRTGEFVPSGVYIVAAAGQDGEGTAYGKVAVIR
jgi:ligand-binding sensor domain-containing protein